MICCSLFPMFLSVCAHSGLQCFDLYSCLDLSRFFCLFRIFCHVNQVVGTNASYSFGDKAPDLL